MTDSAVNARVYVLDTSVLLSDPWALQHFAEHEVVIPLVVLTELEGKRHHPELGWAARETLRMLEDLRLAHGSLLRPMPANDQGGTLRVEVNHTDTAGFPAALSAETNDHRILAVGRSLANEGRDVVVVTKDLPLRLKASIVGLEADEYRNELASDANWAGMAELDVGGATIDALFDAHVVALPAARDLIARKGVAPTAEPAPQFRMVVAPAAGTFQPAEGMDEGAELAVGQLIGHVVTRQGSVDVTAHGLRVFLRHAAQANRLPLAVDENLNPA